MDSTATIILAGALFIIMIGMGLSLTIQDFKRVLKFPLAIAIGLLNQIVLLPLVAYLLVKLLHVAPEIAVGVMILSACPGGPTSNLLTHLAKGDTALSVSLTAINSVITIFTIPLIVNFALNQFGDIAQVEAPLLQIMLSLVAIIAVPLTLGMVIKYFRPTVAIKLDRPVRMASAGLLVFIIVGLLIKERANFVDYFEQAWLVVVLLNISTMSLGYLSARVCKLPFRQALSICIESGNQNGTLAISIAVGLLANTAYAIAAAVYSLIMYVTAIIPVWIGNKKAKREGLS